MRSPPPAPPRAVPSLFSGIAFVLAMLGLPLLVPSTIFRSLAAGAILVGIVSVIAALTLLPAVLALLGDRVNALRIPFFGRAAEHAGREGRFWGAIVDRVMRRPVASLVLAAACCSRSPRPCSRSKRARRGRRRCPTASSRSRATSFSARSFRGVDRAGRDRGRRRRSRGRRGRRSRRLEQSSRTGRSSGKRPSRRTRPARSPASRSRPRAIQTDRMRSRPSASFAARSSPRAFAGVDAEVHVGGDTAEELDYHDTVNFWLPLVLVFSTRAQLPLAHAGAFARSSCPRRQSA